MTSRPTSRPAILALALILLVASPAAAGGLLFLESRHAAYADTTGRNQPENPTFPYVGLVWEFEDDVSHLSPELLPAYAEVDAAIERPELFFIPSNKARAAAWQSAVGLNSVATEYFFDDMHRITTSAWTYYRVTFTNDGTEPVPVLFDFFLTGGSMEFQDPVDSGARMAAGVDAIFSYRKEGESRREWWWESWIVGDTDGPDSWELKEQTPFDDFGIPLPSVSAFANDHAVFGTVAPFSHTIDAGMLAPGETALAIYQIGAFASGAGYGTGASASLGDPYSFLAGSGLTIRVGSVPGPSPSAVPEPSTALLLAPVLLGSGAWMLARGRVRRARA